MTVNPEKCNTQERKRDEQRNLERKQTWRGVGKQPAETPTETVASGEGLRAVEVPQLQRESRKVRKEK